MEGASGDLIPKMKELFGVTSFDLVFLDHWKDRYLPDTKLMEASLVVSLFKSKSSLFHDALFFLSPARFRSAASSGKAASCWRTTSSVPELPITWITCAAAIGTRASTSSLTWSTPKWWMAWRSRFSWGSLRHNFYSAMFTCWLVKLRPVLPRIHRVDSV